MEKQWFNEQVENIEVPNDEVLTAIQKGMTAGRKVKSKKSKRKVSTLFGTAAASLILASGFVFTPVNNVFAAVPVIGQIYEKLDLGIGKDLFAQHLVTELNEKATSHGIGITLTSAYYDGNIIGVTFLVSGQNLSLSDLNRDNAPEPGYGHYIFDGKEKHQWSSSMTGLKKTNEGLIGAIEFEYPNKKLPKDFKLPLTFNYLAGQNGVWKFEVPVKHIPSVRIPVHAEGATDNHAYTVKINNIIKGKATTLIDFDSIRPVAGKHDDITINAFDDKGNRLGIHSIGPIDHDSYTESNNTITVQERASYGKIPKDAKYLMLYPSISRDEFDIREPIQTAPFEVKSERFNYKIEVNSVKHNGEQLVLKYHIKNVDADKYKMDIFDNFADQITLIRSEDVIDSDDGQKQFDALKDDSLIFGKNGKVLNKKDLYFESSFNLKDTKGFNVDDYSLMVPFGIFSMNDDIKMAPIKVELP